MKFAWSKQETGNSLHGVLTADLFPNTQVIVWCETILIYFQSIKKGVRKFDRSPSQMESTMKIQKLSTTQLEDLPVEVLLNVLNYLELPDLNLFGQVSKRLKSVSLVESLWGHS